METRLSRRWRSAWRSPGRPRPSGSSGPHKLAAATERTAPAPPPLYSPPHKMAPAPPGNESPDWLALPGLVTSPPRAPPRPRARLRRAQRAGRKRAVTAAGRGSGPGRQLESPPNALSAAGEARGGGKGGRREEEALPAGPRLLPHANTRAPRTVLPSPRPQLRHWFRSCLSASPATSVPSLPADLVFSSRHAGSLPPGTRSEARARRLAQT